MSERFERAQFYQDISRRRDIAPLTPSEREDFHSSALEVVENAEVIRLNGQFIGSGEIADVFTGVKGSSGENICLKFVARHPAKAAYTNSLEQEMQMQVKAFDIVQEGKKGAPMAKIPRPIAYLKSEGGSEYLAMERVRGKTLYRILLERMAEQMPEYLYLPGMRREDISALSDEDIERMVIWDYLKAQQRTRKELYNIILKRLEEKPFLSVGIVKKVRNAINALHGVQFYHRDLHEKNIMVSDDLTDAYLIDFGSASSGEYSSPSDAFEVDKSGEEIRFLDDKYILTVLDHMTVKA
ncbi:MAG: aminoglycoside phosphotransferase family protein [Patescibacteria group bacterium]